MRPGHASSHAPTRPEPSGCHGHAPSLATPPSGPQAWPRPQPRSVPEAQVPHPQTGSQSWPRPHPAPPPHWPRPHPAPPRTSHAHTVATPTTASLFSPHPGRVSKFCKGAASSGRIHALRVRFQRLQPRVRQLQRESPPGTPRLPQVQPPGLGSPALTGRALSPGHITSYGKPYWICPPPPPTPPEPPRRLPEEIREATAT